MTTQLPTLFYTKRMWDIIRICANIVQNGKETSQSLIEEWGELVEEQIKKLKK